MEASLFRVNSVPNHHSIRSASSTLHLPRHSSGTSVFSSSRIAGRLSLHRQRGGGGSSSRGSAPRAPAENNAIARQSAPGDSRARQTANGHRSGCAKGSEMGDYYREMLESSPNCSLLLWNYAKFLHEVERDAERAEAYNARAILASPDDGEVLSLYGRLIWEAERDKDRAGLYFVRAVNASPDDCMVLGSYAHFLWEAGEEDEETV